MNYFEHSVEFHLHMNLFPSHPLNTSDPEMRLKACQLLMNGMVTTHHSPDLSSEGSTPLPQYSDIRFKVKCQLLMNGMVTTHHSPDLRSEGSTPLSFPSVPWYETKSLPSPHEWNGHHQQSLTWPQFWRIHLQMHFLICNWKVPENPKDSLLGPIWTNKKISVSNIYLYFLFYNLPSYQPWQPVLKTASFQPRYKQMCLYYLKPDRHSDYLNTVIIVKFLSKRVSLSWSQWY